MALPANENFTGSNGDQVSSLANWTIIGGSMPDYDIQSNEAQADASAAEGGDYWDADSFDNDQYAEVTLTALGSALYVGPAVRCSTSAETYYGWYTDAFDASYLFKSVGGSWTQIGDAGVVGSTSEVWRLEASGTTITPKVDGSEEDPPGAQTDSAIASGYAGIICYGDGAARIDDWEGGNLGGAAPAPSVSDAVGVAESITVDVADPQIAVSDAVGVAESVGRVLESLVAVSDAVAVAESVAASIQATTTPTINVSDAVGVAESVTADVSDPQITVSDAIAVAESIGRQLISYISVSDAVAVAEAIGRALVSHVAVSDAVGVAESIGRLLTSFVNVSDAVGVAESVNLSIGAAGAFEINVSDTVTVGEADSADVSDPQVSVSEAVGVAESVSVSIIIGYNIGVSDAVAVAEAVTVTMADLALSVSESVAVAETVGRALVALVGVSDTVAAAESVTALLLPQVNVSDAIAVAESTSAAVSAPQVNVSDSITVTDSPTVSVEGVVVDRNISVSDSVSVSDVAIIAVFLAAGPPGLRVASSGTGAIRAGPQIVGTVRTAGTDGPVIRNTDQTG